MSSEALEAKRLRENATRRNMMGLLMTCEPTDVLALLAEVARLEQERAPAELLRQVREQKAINAQVVRSRDEHGRRADDAEAALAVAREREQRAVELLDATEADALALLDQHASPEVHNETRTRLIKRAATRAALAEPGSVRPVEQARPGSASAAADEPLPECPICGNETPEADLTYSGCPSCRAAADEPGETPA